MKLYETFGKPGFHTSIATSFGIDFDTYENVMLARLRGAGCFNNLVTVDAGMLALALEDRAELPRYAGRTYTITPVGSRGVFHPKILLQLGRSSGRLIVSSANITAAGLAGNLEVAGTFETEDKDAGEARLIAAAWRFLSGFLDQDLEGVRRQVEWMQARTPWLRSVVPAEGVVELSDASAGAFFGTNSTVGIARRFLQCFDGEKVHRLIIVSPYWDDDLASLNFLLAEIAPSEAILLLDQGRQSFSPVRIAPEVRKRVKLIDFKPKGTSRFIHAKIVIAQTSRNDHVLYGSANCTLAALGDARFKGSNAEACIYRSLPAGAAIDALGISETLQAQPVPHNEFEVVEPSPDIPLDDFASRFPGHFTCAFETLIWSPPAGADPAHDRIELQGKNGTPLSEDLQRFDNGDDGTVRFQLAGNERPSFARVRRRDGSLSTLAIVVLLDELRDAMRDARNRRVDAALAPLDGETDLGLWLLETLNELEAAEAMLTEGETPPVRRATKTGGRPDNSAKPERKLTYQEFMAGRRLRSEVEGLHRNSLSGSNFSYVRGFLNRILSIGEASAVAPEDEIATRTDAFDLGDETRDAEAGIEGGIEFSMPPTPPKHSTDSADERVLRRATQRRANREQLIAAVGDLADMVAEKASGEGLRSVDLLRLRAVVTILATAGWDGVGPPQNSLQVLPAAGDTIAAWPRLIGKTLFTYFGGRKPPIQTLMLDGFYDQVPDDILECWACCIWAVQAAVTVAARYREYESLSRGLASLRDSIYRVVALNEEELNDTRIGRVLDALNDHFRGSLKLDCEALRAAHRRTVSTFSRLDAG